MLLATLFIIYIPFVTPKTIRADAVATSLSKEEASAILDGGGEIFARPKEGGAGLYADRQTTDLLFSLPYSFFARVAEIGEDALKVTYCYEDYDYARAVSGYVRHSEVCLTDLAPTGKSFPNIFPRFEGNGTFYKNNRLDSFYSPPDTLADDTFFYGFLDRGEERYCYVFCGGKLGYFSVEVFEEIELPTHPSPMPAERMPASESQSSDSASSPVSQFFSSDTNKIIFICVAAVIAVCAAYLLFLPKRSQKTDEDCED